MNFRCVPSAVLALRGRSVVFWVCFFLQEVLHDFFGLPRY